jgi:hypothetical protein
VSGANPKNNSNFNGKSVFENTGNCMNDPEYNELRTASWRRRLTPSEEARVQAHLALYPEAQAQWEEDQVLTRHLQELPDVPVSSNFTSLVMQSIDAEAVCSHGRAAVPSRFTAWLRRLAPRIALAGIVALLAVTGVFEYEHHNRKQFADAMERFVQASNVPGPEVFEDFDAIKQLQPVAFSKDEDLLAALR